MSFSNEVVLKDVSEYSKEKIDIGEISISNYVSTENLLPDIGGKALSSGLPSKGKATKYCKGDILISNIRPYFKKIWQADNEGGSSNDVLVLKAKRNIEGKFLYYNLACSAFFDYVMSGAKGTKMPRGDKNHILGYKLNLPPMQEQKAIAHILSTLDDKIEVNNQINKTLENMAQATFKQWFVDFEFPNEDGEPYKSSGGEMVESELGMIPKGWEVRRIGDECFCSLGGTPSRQKSDYWNGDIPWVNSGEVNNFRIYKPSEYITKLGLEKSATKLLKKKTTVLAITGATLGQVSLLEIDTCTNQSVVGISENDKISHVYIYPYVKSVIKKIIGNQTGGAQQHINKGNVEDTKLLIPNKKVLNAYTKLVRPQYDLISSICFENELLTRLRDSLIPKLMSGEIRVPINNN